MTPSYEDLVRSLLVAPRGPDCTRELLGVAVDVKPRDTVQRLGLSVPLADEMARQFIAGESNLDLFKRAAPFHDDELWAGHPFEGESVGPNTWPLMRENAGGRRAIHVFEPNYCWTSFQALRRRGKLSVVVFQRSCDVWRGLPYDLAMIQAAWKHVAGNDRWGSCTWFIGSLHLYDRDSGVAERLFELDAPLREVLYCPNCKRQHIDGRWWARRPHSVHDCRFCGHKWREARPSIGVSSLTGA